MNKSDFNFMEEAIQLSIFGMQNNHGGPFGAIIVRDNIIIGRGYNKVTSTNDPTAHAEVVAIRDACNSIGSFQLNDCILYTSCEPCPMCLGAIYWARIDKVFYAANKFDAAQIGFDDAFIYEEFSLNDMDKKVQIIKIHIPISLLPFELWNNKDDKKKY